MAFGDTIQSADTSGGSGANVTPTLGAGATAGNLLVAGFTSADPCTWGAISGWTEITIVDGAGNMDAVWYYKIASGGETSVTSNRTGTGNIRGAIAEFAGPFDATPLDQTADDETHISSVTTSQASGTTGTTTASDELALVFFAADVASNVDLGRSYSNSFTEVIFASTSSTPARPAVILAKRVLSATGTYSCTYSTTEAGDRMYGAIATFKMQSSNTAPTVTPDTADGATFSDSTPTLLFTGSDVDGDDIVYEIQISDNAAFASGTNTTDTYDTGSNFISIHPNPSSGLTWEGNQKIDDRPGQSFTAKGGILDKVRMHLARDEADTDGVAYVKVYAHQGTFGTSSEPLNAADPADTPTSGWLAISDGVPLNGTMSTSVLKYDFAFSGANRIKLEDGQKYVLILDWVPNGTSEPNTNTVVVRGSTTLGHSGNAYVDGNEPANNGVYSPADMLFDLLQVQIVLDKTSDVAPGFVNETNGADTSPFTSGNQISYTVQAGDTLTDGVYYWRVRGNDGQATGDWTATRSFTVDTSGVSYILPPGITSGAAFGTATLQRGAVSVSPSGIASAEAFGTLTIALSVTPVSIASAESFGTPSLNLIIQPGGIASGEAFGTALMQPGAVSIQPTGISSAEVFGTAKLNLNTTPSGIATGEAFGNPTLTLNLSPTGITSAEAFGTPKINLSVVPLGIASAEAFGTPTINTGALTVSPAGVASAETFGSVKLNLNIVVSGITSAEVFGTPSIGGGAAISPSGIASAEVFGSAKLNLNITVSSTGSAETFGNATIQPGVVLVSPSSIAGAEVFGTPVVTTGTTIVPSSIGSGEAFGTLSVTRGAVSITLSGIGSAEAFGTPSVAQNIAPSGITSSESFGAASVQPGVVSINPVSIASAEGIGTPVVTRGAVSVLVSGIGTGEVFGSPTIELVGYGIYPSSIQGAEIFGTPVLTTGAVSVSPSGIAGAETFGTLIIANDIEIQPLMLAVYVCMSLAISVHVSSGLTEDVYVVEKLQKEVLV